MEKQMSFEPSDVAKLLAMTGCLLSVTVIACVISDGKRPPLQRLARKPWRALPCK